MRIILGVLILMLVACTAAPPRPVLPAQSAPAAETASVDSGPSGESRPLRIVVHKKERRLELFRGEELIHTYPIALGFAPEGAKLREGDGRTPEGEYYVSVKNPNSQFYLSLGISYPNRLDAERAWFNGRITRQEYLNVARAIERQATPPWNTVLGGAIYIHGFGTYRDWTRGCIAMRDQDVEELFNLVQVGTTVIIHP